MILSAISFAILAVLIALVSATFSRVTKQKVIMETLVAPYPSLGIPGYENQSWDDIVASVSGQTVRFYTCATCARYNSMIDNFVIPQLQQTYGINMIRVPADAANVVVSVQAEMTAGNTNKGSVDMVWVNLENFANLKKNGLVYGPWADKVPSIVNFNRSDTSVFFDGGLAIDGYELPYNGAQCVFIYNKQLVASTADVASIQTIPGLATWLKANPGKFTYAAPGSQADGKTGDYTGSAFLRHVFYALSGPYTDFLQTTVNMDLYKSRAPKTFQFLRSIEQYLYKATAGVVVGTGASYPTSNAAVDVLFGQKRVALTLSYDAFYAAKQVLATGAASWNATDPQGYILDSGTIANTNYLAIPANSPNKLAAVVAANAMASPAAMFYRYKVVGALQVFDPTLDVFTTGGWNTAFDSIPTPSQVPPRAARVAGRLGELSGAYITQIQADWYKCVLKYAGPSADSPQCG